MLKVSRSGNNSHSKSRLVSLTYFTLGLSIFIISAIMICTLELKTSYAETGLGKDVFKVIVSVFGISNETGDIVTTVNVNGNSKVKSFDSDNLNYWQTSSDNSSTRLIEYIATFPGIEVKPGDQYKACVLLVETTHTICKEGTNSPGKRPEVVDISLDSETPTTPPAIKLQTGDKLETTSEASEPDKAVDTQKDTDKAVDTQKDTDKAVDTQKDTDKEKDRDIETSDSINVGTEEFRFLD